MDMWLEDKFYEGCGNKTNTVTLARMGKYVFGGFTDRNWDSKWDQNIPVYTHTLRQQTYKGVRGWHS